jgi:hypothetical protein
MLTTHSCSGNRLMPTSENLPNWALGYHSAWERRLHRADALAQAENREISHAERQDIVDEFVRRYPQNASDIVHCEICQAKIEAAHAAGEDIWSCPPTVRESLEKFGFKIPKRGRIPQKVSKEQQAN